jgi:hypothetical protein
VHATDPLRPLRQRAFRHAFEDGTADIVTAVFTLMVGGATQNRSLIALTAIYLVVLPLAWRFFSQQVSSRRIGYAELPEDPPRVLLLATMAAGVVTLGIVALITLSSGRIWNLEQWPNWAPLVAGSTLAAGFLVTACRAALPRYYIYAAASVGGSVFFWLYPFGPRINPSDRLTLLFFALAGVLLASGIAVLVRFVRAQPVRQAEGYDG